MKYLGIDYGTKRIGIAVSDAGGHVALPVSVIEAGLDALSEVVELATKNGVQQIVIGESQRLDGEANPVQEEIGQFKKDLEELSALPVEYERESFTSSLAARQWAPDG